jgi:hypothetical protein
MKLERLLIGGLALLLLAGAGYMTLDEISSLNDLDQTLSTLTANLSAKADATEVEDTSQGSSDVAPPDEEGEADSADGDEDINLLLPTDNDTFVISSKQPEVQIRLKNLMTVTLDVQAQLLVLKKVEGDTREALGSGLASELKETELPPGEAKNVTLEFTQALLPPSGTYEAWLLVTADNGKPISKKLTLEIASHPLASIQHRLGDKKGEERTIYLGGVRWWPLTISWPWDKSQTWWPKLRNNPAWEEYELRLWEKNLQETGYVLLPSELVDDATGRTGYLDVKPFEGTTENRPLPVSLSVKDIRHPGTYKGTLTLLAPDGSQLETVNVVVRLRDSLLWPFVIIVLGALCRGWLVRHGGIDTKTSVPFQRFLIATARNRLRNVPECATGGPECSPKCSEIEATLRQAELALVIGDLNTVAACLKQARDELEALELARGRIEAAERSINARKDVLYSKYPKDEETIDLKIKEIKKTLLTTAQKLHREGKLVEMKKELDKIPAALDEIAAGLKGTAELDKDAEYQIESDPELENGTFFTDQTITFSVKDQYDNDVSSSFHWVTKWDQPLKFEPFDPVLDEDDGSEYKYPIRANEHDDYARRWERVKALHNGQEIAALRFAVRHRYEIKLPDKVYAGRPTSFTLDLMTEETSLVEEVTWSFYDSQGGHQDCKPIAPTSRQEYSPKTPGKYRIAVLATIDGEKNRCIAASDLIVIENPIDIAAKQFKHNARRANVTWAMVAGVAGLIYINARLPTFGSPLDYLLALAWGLGLSTSVAQGPGVVSTIMKGLGLKAETQSPDTSKPVGKDVPEKKETVPPLKGMKLEEAKKEAEKVKCELVNETSDAKPDDKVNEQTPEPGKPIPEDRKIKVKLAPPPPDDEEEREEGSQGSD